VTSEAAVAIRTGLGAAELEERVRSWIEMAIPAPWQEAALRGGGSAIRKIRSRAEYEAWYPTFASTGLVAPTWPVEYGGAGLTPEEAREVEALLQPYNLGRLNPLGLSLTAPALFSFGTEEQRRRFLPPIVRNEETWCQLFSEPGAGSDLASLSTRAIRDGETWVITGQKVWNTWAHLADFGVLLARTDTDVPKRQGITYFLIDMRQPGVDVRPLRHITGEIDFNEVFLDGALVPDEQRVGEVNEGWAVGNATLSGERQMVSGAGSGGVDRIGGSGAERLIALAKANSAQGLSPGWEDPLIRQEVAQLVLEERVRNWTNQRVRAGAKAGRPLGAASSVGKIHQGSLNQRVQLMAATLLGQRSLAWPAGAADPEADPRDLYAESLPYEVKSMLRSRANTIEGGTTEINLNIVAERVLGLPREADPYRDLPWRDVPRS
jgi:alkylation response protein AidB-like acyl-CoA dehydrogenase